MPQHTPRSLKYEYELFVENEIENYKESVSRSAILMIGDEAVSALRANEQFAMDELLLCEEVEHWGLRPDGILAREIRPPAESKVLVAGADEGTALYLAAHGCDVTALGTQADALERVMAAAHEAGLTDRIEGQVAGLRSWSPQSVLSAVVCTPSAFDGLDADERGRAIELLQSATRDGGVHLVGTIVSGRRGISLTELRKRYKGWTISVEEESVTAKSFLARKIAS